MGSFNDLETFIRQVYIKLKNRSNGCYNNEKAQEVNWPCHLPRSLLLKKPSSTGSYRECKGGASQRSHGPDSREARKQTRNSKGPVDVEDVLHCSATCLPGMSGHEWGMSETE